MSATQCLFRDDAYLSTAEGRVVAVNERGGIILDRTVFYATSGGQPGDTGRLERADGSMIEIAATLLRLLKQPSVNLVRLFDFFKIFYCSEYTHYVL